MVTEGKLEYNGVVIELKRHTDYLELTVKFTNKWKAKGYIDQVYRKGYAEESYIKSQFRMMVKEYVSIH